MNTIFLVSSFTAATSIATSDATTPRLISWILQNNGGMNAKAGVSADGLRGLVVERAANVGDVLLEVPLSLCISDGDAELTPLPEAAPSWAWELPWNVQLAVAVLERRSKHPKPDPFLDSWPDLPPPLPTTSDATELALASDPSLAQKADEAFFWLDEQYWKAREAAAAHRNLDPADAACFVTEGAFRDAMELVWSRCLRITADAEHGVRRVLVPLLDLANHEACPSAMYAYSNGATCGPAIRLHAAKPLEPGDAITITYGEHTSMHFALYYGFVPSTNPSDCITMSLGDILATLPPALLGDGPPDGLASAAHAALEKRGYDADTQLELYERAPSAHLLDILAELLPGGDRAACEALACACAAVERALWGYSATTLLALDAEAQAGVAADEALLTKADEAATLDAGAITPGETNSELLTDRGQVLVRLRLARRRLLASLRRTLVDTASTLKKNKTTADVVINALKSSAQLPAVYPAFDQLPLEELEVWATRAWDWEHDRWKGSEEL